MPGIPRSKGCINCRERKVGCDGSKPECLKCKKTGRKCKGYQKQPTVFVNCAAPTAKRAYHRAPPPKSKEPELLDAPTTGPVVVDHMLALFLDDYLPKGQKQIAYNHQYGLSWAQYMPGIGDKTELLTKSLAAVSLAIVGRTNTDENLVKCSFEIYGNALQDLQKALAKPTSRSSQDTLAAMMALTTYELWQPTFQAGHGWMAHVQGASRIVQDRGPVVAKEPLDMCLLSNFRTSSIFDALGRRKACFLGREEWQQTRSANPKLNELVLDIVVHIPALLEQTDIILETSSPDSPDYSFKCAALLRVYASVQEQLENWYKHAESMIPSPMYWEYATPDVSVESKDFPFDPSFEFSSLPVAQLMLIYWTARTILYCEMDKLASPPISGLESTSGKSPESEDQDIEPTSPYFNLTISTADLIPRSVRYCILPIHGMAGVQSLVFPLWVVQHPVYSTRSKRKQQFIASLSRILAGRKGLHLLSTVTGLTKEDYKTVGRVGLTPRLTKENSGGQPGWLNTKSSEEWADEGESAEEDGDGD